MKKTFLTLLISLLISNSVYANNDYGFRGPLNFIQVKLLEKTISTQVKKEFKGSVNTKINSYGAKALRNGVFKSAELELNNCLIEGISISRIQLKTTSIENKLDISDLKNIKLLSNIDAEFYTTLSNEDLKSILASSFYKKEIAKINTEISPLASINIGDIYCRDDRLFIKMEANTIGIKMNTTCSSKINVEGNNILLKDIKFNKKNNSILSTNIKKDLEGLNPIKTTIEALDNSNFDIKPTSINIINDKIEISGIIKIYNKD